MPKNFCQAGNLILIYTGSGKGKTTAALGLVWRALRDKMKVMMVQFIKSEKQSGEVSLKKIMPKFEIKCFGLGFITLKHKNINDVVSSLPTGDTMHFRSSQENGANKTNDKHKMQAQNGFAYAKHLLKSKKYDVIILDEILVALNLKLLKFADIIDLIKEFKKTDKKMYLILTGRNCPKNLYKYADLVTEMKEIKHPFQKGVLAVKGIDF